MTAYYNEIDPEKAAWIRELIREGMVAPGEVDERSITDVRADDLRGFTQCHFFAGIAVWSYALRLAGWPDDRPCWTGSCPCPSFSAAGKGEGFDDARHLWPAWWPLIRECRPATIFGEQVAAAIRHGWWDLVSTDLESEAYAAAAAVLTSASVGGSDIRERLYWVADSASVGRQCFSREESAGVLDQADEPRELWHEPGMDGAGIVRLADSDERRSEQCDAGERAIQFTGAEREADRLAESLHPERRPLSLDREDGRNRENGGWTEAHGEPGTCSEVFGLGHAYSEGLSERERGRRIQPSTVGSSPRQATECSSITGRLADSDGGKSRLGELQRSGQHGLVAQDGGLLVEHFAADALKGFWRTADWLFCTDGRWRPVEAGTFPLDSGSAFRLGRLRGYGDAINAEVAKAFIEARLETDQQQVTGVSGRWPR